MKNWFVVFILFFVLGLLVYSNSFNNKFLMDDYVFLSNPALSHTKYISSQWDPYGQKILGVMDKQATDSYYRPMAHIVLDVCYNVFKSNFWQYHLFNLLLFSFAASLVYLLIGKISGDHDLAFLTGLFYLIHPINGIVVNYISACVFSLQMIFMLSTVLLFWVSLERKNDRVCYFLSLLFSFLSFFWNESGIMIPFYAAAVILLFRDEPVKRKALFLFPYFLIIAAYMIFRFNFISINESILKQIAFAHISPGEYLASLFRVIGWYISQLFYPQGIVMQWAIPVLRDHLLWNDLGAALMLLFFIMLFVRFADERICRLAVLWLMTGFAPVCLAAFKSPQIGVMIEPHWFIFSSIGFFILVAYCSLRILKKTWAWGIASIFIMIFAWSVVSHEYNKVWADQLTYSRYWSQKVPGFKPAYFYLAEAYQKQGDLNGARRYYVRSLLGDASDVEIYNNLGLIDAQDGRLKQAELDLREALKFSTYSGSIYNNLGDLYLSEGQVSEAKGFFERALALNPLLIEPRRSLAGIDLAGGEDQKAIDLCLENLKIVDDDKDTLLLLVGICLKEKQFAAVKMYAERFINSENDPAALTQLGVSLSQNSLYDIAWECYRKALRVAPDYKDAYFNAGSLLGNFGQYDLAIHIWQRGLKIDPSDNRFRDAIARALMLRSK